MTSSDGASTEDRSKVSQLRMSTAHALIRLHEEEPYREWDSSAWGLLTGGMRGNDAYAIMAQGYAFAELMACDTVMLAAVLRDHLGRIIVYGGFQASSYAQYVIVCNEALETVVYLFTQTFWDDFPGDVQANDALTRALQLIGGHRGWDDEW
jgi:hypothetical protein